MDQGPIKRPPAPRWRLADTVELGRAALRQLAVGLGLALAGAAAWAALSTGTFRGRLPLTLVVAAAIMPMFTFVSVRADMAMYLDRVGQASQAPGEEDIDGLTSLGTLLFVSLPMVVLATALGL